MMTEPLASNEMEWIPALSRRAENGSVSFFLVEELRYNLAEGDTVVPGEGRLEGVARHCQADEQTFRVKSSGRAQS